MDIHRFGGDVSNRLRRFDEVRIGKVSVTRRGLDQCATEQLGDGHHIHAVHGGDRSPVVAKIMNPQSGQSRLVADAVPLISEVVDVPRRRTRQKQVRAIVTVSRDGVDDRVRGEDATVAGFGRFAKTDRPAREGHNPRIRERTAIGSSAGVSFKAAKALEDALN